MKNHILSFGAAIAVVLGAVTAAVGQTPAAPAVTQLPPVPAVDPDGAFAGRSQFGEPTGEKIYRRVCAGCHMPDAKGAVGAGAYPALAGNKKLAASGYPAYVVLHGLNGMPPIGGMMNDQQVADVVNYVRTHFGNKYKDSVSAADIKQLR